MEPRAQHVLIGLFTLLAVGAALLFSLWLARPGPEQDFGYFVIRFDRPVSGLNVGSTVEYSGVPVGEVTSLQLHPEDPQRVRALIRVRPSTPVNEDTRASLRLAGITGAMTIQLYGGTPESERLKGSRTDPPLIPAEPSALGAALESGEGLVTQVSELVTRLNDLFSDENIARFSHTLANLEQTTNAINAERDAIRRALSRLDQLSRQTGDALAAVQRLASNTDAALNDEQQGILVRASESMAALERASARVDRLLADNERALDSGLQGLGELGPAIGELRDTLTSLKRLSRRLEANPGELIFGAEEVREFEP